MTLKMACLLLKNGIVMRLTDHNGETTTLSTDIADVGGVSTNHTGDNDEKNDCC